MSRFWVNNDNIQEGRQTRKSDFLLCQHAIDGENIQADGLFPALYSPL